jgi:hypothetical protein
MDRVAASAPSVAAVLAPVLPAVDAVHHDGGSADGGGGAGDGGADDAAPRGSGGA